MDTLRIGVKPQYTEAEVDLFKQVGPFSDKFLKSEGEVQSFISHQLSIVFHEFQCYMRSVPIIAKMEDQGLPPEEYLNLIRNLRAQVVDGVPWMMRAASSLPNSPVLTPLRQQILKHATEESGDYTMLDADYISMGGNQFDILKAEKNIGSQCLSDMIFWNASIPKPYALAGTIFIIEGQPQREGWNRWSLWYSKLLQAGIPEKSLSFFKAHATKDIEHSKWIETLFNLPIANMDIAKSVVKLARMTARLYAVQFEQIDNY